MDNTVRFSPRYRASVLHWRCSFASRIVAGLTSLAFSSLIVFPSFPPAAYAASQRKIYFYHPDHLGSTSLVTDEQGHVVEYVEYTPYGTIHHREGSVNVPQKFTGQRLDSSTGLYYYHGRYYDPQLGRFTQPDPYIQDPSDPQFLNRYSYVRNNPVNLVDPSGHFAFLAFLGAMLIKAAIGAAASVAIGAVTGQIHNVKDMGRFAAVGASVGAIGGAGAYAFGANGLGLAGIAKGVADFGTFVGSGAVGGGVDSVMSHGSFGRGALFGAAFAGALYGIGLGFSAFARTPLGERLGETALGGLKRLADSSAGRAIQRAFGQAGAETAETAVSRIPLGFQSASQFTRAANQFIEAAGVDDALVGVRGSAATGVTDVSIFNGYNFSVGCGVSI